MLRASTSMAARALYPFRRSLISILTLPHPSPTPKSNYIPPMEGHTFLSGTASFSSVSSGASREILVQHLLVKEEDYKLLLEVQKRLSEGEDLRDLAVEYSICPSKDKGGILGWVKKGQMAPEFEEASFSAPVNKVVRLNLDGIYCKFSLRALELLTTSVLSREQSGTVKEIQPDELHVKLQDSRFIEEVQLIDVREPEEVELASVPGFQVLPLGKFERWAPEITSKFDPHKDTYVLCHHGRRSLKVAQWLQTQGFSKIYNVSGGIDAYAVKVDPSIPTY